MTNLPQTNPQIAGFAVVLLGSFNPKILQPAWLAAQGLIRMEEAESAEIGLIRPELVAFSLDWVKFQVLTEKFTASTVKDPLALKDLVCSMFKILTHTPVTAVGLNCDFHFRMSNIEAWHAVGDRLAPKEPWREMLNRPGLKTITLQGHRDDKYEGNINVTVEPSVPVVPGVYIRINDHYDIKNSPPEAGCRPALEILEHEWLVSLDRAKKIAQNLLELT